MRIRRSGSDFFALLRGPIPWKIESLSRNLNLKMCTEVRQTGHLANFLLPDERLAKRVSVSFSRNPILYKREIGYLSPRKYDTTALICASVSPAMGFILPLPSFTAAVIWSTVSA